MADGGRTVEGSVCNCGLTEVLGNFENKRNRARAQCKLRSPDHRSRFTSDSPGGTIEPNSLPVVGGQRRETSANLTLFGRSCDRQAKGKQPRVGKSFPTNPTRQLTEPRPGFGFLPLELHLCALSY